MDPHCGLAGPEDEPAYSLMEEPSLYPSDGIATAQVAPEPATTRIQPGRAVHGTQKSCSSLRHMP
jgi:hypothetical protein